MKQLALALMALTLCLPAHAQSDIAPDCRSVAERMIAIAGEMSGELPFSDDEREAVTEGIASDLHNDDTISCADLALLSDQQLAVLFIGTSGD